MKRTLGALALALLTASCGQDVNHARAVYLLVDTSGTYVHELGKAEKVFHWLIGTLHAGDTLALARIKSRSYSEKEIVAEATFVKDPLQVNQQKRALLEKFAALKTRAHGGSAYTDITGGIIQAAEFLKETGAASKTIIIFSDMKEDLDRGAKRDIPLKLTGVRVVALNVIKLKSDNQDPRRYERRLAAWEKRVKKGGAAGWRVVNDLEQLDRIFDD